MTLGPQNQSCVFCRLGEMMERNPTTNKTSTSEDQKVGGAQEVKEKLGQAFSQGHGLMGGQQVCQHPRNHSGSDQHLHEGEVTEEEVYG